MSLVFGNHAKITELHIKHIAQVTLLLAEKLGQGSKCNIAKVSIQYSYIIYMITPMVN